MTLSHHRQIRHLRVRCGRKEQSSRARILIEDAMRTATFNDGTRLVVVRRLHLGVIPPNATSTFLSRRIEEAFRSLQAQAISVLDPSANKTSCVYFEHPTQPWFLLAVRAAAGLDSTEWFWTKAAPGWDRNLGPERTLRLAFRTLAVNSPEDALTLLEYLSRQGLAGKLLNALTHTEIGLVLPENIPATRPAASLDDDSRLKNRPDFELQPFPWTRNGLRELHPEDPRALLCYASIFVTSGRPIPSLNTLRSIAQFLLKDLSDVREKSADSIDPNGNVSVRTVSKKRVEADPIPDEEMAPKIVQPSSNPGETNSLLWTHCGGLFFLVPLLDRLGLPDLWQQNPDFSQSGSPWKLLRAALRLAHAQPRDCLWRILDDADRNSDELVWKPLLKAHHLCKRMTELTLRQLIFRNANVAFHATHIDVHFKLNDADIRIRRAGLDIDPGWVWWLQRTIQYHFHEDH